MNSLVQYYDSDEERSDVSRPTAQSVRLNSAPALADEAKAPEQTSKPALFALSSLPAPKNTKRRRLPIVAEQDGTKETQNDLRISTAANADISAKVPYETADEPNAEETGKSTGDQVSETPLLLIDDEIQGPSAVPEYEPPPLPHIMFRGRLVPPPPGLIPPSGLKVNGDVDVSNGDTFQDMPHDWVAGLRKGNIMQLTQDDLRRFELSRPVDPLNASRGELIQSEIAAGLWTSKQGQLLSTAQATFNQSRRHHINSMASTAALMEESIRQQASVGQDRRRMAKAKYGW